MRDKDKSREQLIDELEELRRKVGEQETSERSRRFIEQHFQNEERLFHITWQASPAFYLVVDEDGRVLMMNQMLLDALGYTLEEALGKEYLGDFIAQRDHKSSLKVLECLAKQDNPIVSENRLLTKDKRELLVEWHGRSILKNEGDIDYWFFIGKDITERGRAEDALRASEQKYRALVESSTDAIMVIDKDRRIVSYNRAFLDLFGFEAADVAGQTTRILHSSDESFRGLEWKVGSALKGENTRVEWELMRKDGTIFPIEETLSTIQGADEEVKTLVGIIRDVTERKKTEVQLAAYRNHLEDIVESRSRDLEAANRALIQKEKLKTLGAISAEVAHEIRNPLTIIGGFAKRLQKKYPDAREVDIILRESWRLEKLLNRISSYLKPVALRHQECSVNDIVKDTLDLLALELDKQSIKRRFEFDFDLPPAYVDSGILTQVMVNVIRSIAKIMNRKDNFVISTYEKNERIHITFRNPILEHIGLKDPEIIFLPFAEGGRLRMPVCSRLLESMGGSLSFVQEQDIAFFTISLPKAADQSAESCVA